MKQLVGSVVVEVRVLSAADPVRPRSTTPTTLCAICAAIWHVRNQGGEFPPSGTPGGQPWGKVSVVEKLSAAGSEEEEDADHY